MNFLRRTAHARLLAALLVLVAPVAAGCGGSASAPRPKDERVLNGELGGAPWLAEVPGRWNGTLVLYSHGYVAPGSPSPAQDAADPLTAGWLLDHGFAIAGSGYHSSGWAVADAVVDQLALLQELRRRLGRPKRILAWGDSMGGLITAELEDARPGLFAGALPMCGLLAGGVATFDSALDGAFALKTLLAPRSRIPLVHLGDGASNLALADQVLDGALATLLGRARLALVAAVAGLPTWYDEAAPPPSDPEQQSVAQAQWERASALPLAYDYRAELELRAGGNPSSNTGVDYTKLLAASGSAAEVEALYREAGGSLQRDLAALAAAPRIAADPAAAAWLRRTSDAGAPTAPTLTLHDTDDGLVIPQHETAYAADRRLFVHRPGHCNFSAGEMVAAWEALLHRLDRGSWGDLHPAALNAAALPLGPDYNGGRTSRASLYRRPAFEAFTPVPFPRA